MYPPEILLDPIVLATTAQKPFYRASVKLPGMSDYFLASMNTTSEGLILFAYSQGVQEFETLPYVRSDLTKDYPTPTFNGLMPIAKLGYGCTLPPANLPIITKEMGTRSVRSIKNGKPFPVTISFSSETTTLLFANTSCGEEALSTQVILCIPLEE